MSKEDLSRREFLFTALAGVVVLAAADLPSWVENISDDALFEEFITLCSDFEYFTKDELLDLFEVADDLEEALGYFYSVLLSKDINPTEYFLIEGFILDERL